MFKKVLIGLSLSVGFSLASEHGHAATPKKETKTASHEKSGHAPHWGYEGLVAAEYWGDLNPEYLACKTGLRQSPINLMTQKVTIEELAKLETNYKPSPMRFLNNGHTTQFVMSPGSKLKVGSDEYDLLQFHFHTPSEEEIDGKPFVMDAHFVHKNAAGQLAVIGVLFKLGAENQTLKQLFAKMPEAGDTILSETKINPLELLPSSLSYWTFQGSLTTPPCSEGVRWLVLKNPVTMSNTQLEAFQAVFKLNARPVQPLNGREVKSSD